MSDYSFKREERLKSRKEIEAILQKGKKANAGGVLLHYMSVASDRKPTLKVVFSVPKRRFKRAVDRNLLKRRMREAYRLNKPEVQIQCERMNKAFNLLFVYNQNEVMNYSDLENKIVLLLKELASLNESIT